MKENKYFWKDLSKEQQEFLIQNYSDNEMCSEKFEKILNIPWKNIQALANRQKLKRRKFFTFNEDYFDSINTEKKAYFLGLLWADGNNYKVKNRIQIALQEQDVDILQKFAEDIELQGFLYKKPGRMEKGYKKLSKPQYTLRFCSKKVSNLLETYGMAPRKTHTLQFPTCVPENLIRHFIRGYFDGDGCIYVHKETIQCKFVLCGSLYMMNKINEILTKECALNFGNVRVGKNLYLLGWGGQYQVKRIRDYLYNNATVYLQRKFNKFNILN